VIAEGTAGARLPRSVVDRAVTDALLLHLLVKLKEK
jgi:hypothetical protein